MKTFQHLVRFPLAFNRRIFDPRPQGAVFRCDLNKLFETIRYYSRHSFGINELFHEGGKGDDLDSLFLDLGDCFLKSFDG
jgi:hypothetical protein